MTLKIFDLVTYYYSELGTEEVTLYVGEARKKFTVHKKLLCKIDFFLGAFCRGFKEGVENTMDLPEDHPEAFELFIDWVYKAKLPAWEDMEKLLVSYAQVVAYHEHLQKFYIFAEKTCIPILPNKIMDLLLLVNMTLRAMDKTLPDTYLRALAAAYDKTTEGSPLRKLFVHSLVWSLWDLGIRNVEEDLVEEDSVEGDSVGAGEAKAVQQGWVERVWEATSDRVDLFEDIVTEFKAYSPENCPKFPRDSRWVNEASPCYFHSHDTEGEEARCEGSWETEIARKLKQAIDWQVELIRVVAQDRTWFMR